MKVPEKITVRLGDLRLLLEQHCIQTGKAPSTVLRESLAKSLKTKPPVMLVGAAGHKVRRETSNTD